MTNDELVEFEKQQLVEVQNLRSITVHFLEEFIEYTPN